MKGMWGNVKGLWRKDWNAGKGVRALEKGMGVWGKGKSALEKGWECRER
jgi:hypothetical protein